MKSYENYFEKDGKYYSQGMVWWEKGGYYIPQTPKEISKDKYKEHTEQKEKGDS